MECDIHHVIGYTVDHGIPWLLEINITCFKDYFSHVVIGAYHEPQEWFIVWKTKVYVCVCVRACVCGGGDCLTK